MKFRIELRKTVQCFEQELSDRKPVNNNTKNSIMENNNMLKNNSLEKIELKDKMLNESYREQTGNSLDEKLNENTTKNHRDANLVDAPKDEDNKKNVDETSYKISNNNNASDCDLVGRLENLQLDEKPTKETSDDLNIQFKNHLRIEDENPSEDAKPSEDDALSEDENPSEETVPKEIDKIKNEQTTGRCRNEIKTEDSDSSDDEESETEPDTRGLDNNRFSPYEREPQKKNLSRSHDDQSLPSFAQINQLNYNSGNSIRSALTVPNVQYQNQFDKSSPTHYPEVSDLQPSFNEQINVNFSSSDPDYDFLKVAVDPTVESKIIDELLQVEQISRIVDYLSEPLKKNTSPNQINGNVSHQQTFPRQETITSANNVTQSIGVLFERPARLSNMPRQSFDLDSNATSPSSVNGWGSYSSPGYDSSSLSPESYSPEWSLRRASGVSSASSDDEFGLNCDLDKALNFDNIRRQMLTVMKEPDSPKVPAPLIRAKAHFNVMHDKEIVEDGCNILQGFMQHKEYKYELIYSFVTRMSHVKDPYTKEMAWKDFYSVLMAARDDCPTEPLLVMYLIAAVRNIHKYKEDVDMIIDQKNQYGHSLKTIISPLLVVE